MINTIIYAPKGRASSFIVTFSHKMSTSNIKHSACLVQDVIYLAAVVSWLWLKLPWHLIAMPAVTTATAALD